MKGKEAYMNTWQNLDQDMSQNCLHIFQNKKEVAECACLKIRYESYLSIRKWSPWLISWQPQLWNRGYETELAYSLPIFNFQCRLVDCGSLSYHCLQFKKDRKLLLPCLSRRLSRSLYPFVVTWMFTPKTRRRYLYSEVFFTAYHGQFEIIRPQSSTGRVLHQLDLQTSAYPLHFLTLFRRRFHPATVFQ